MSLKPSDTKHDKTIRRRRFFKSFEAKALSHRNFWEKAADFTTNNAGSIPFLFLNLYFFAVWIVFNINIIPGVVPFDPFPFGLLTMIVSLEAIILSIFVLLSQTRAAHRDVLRDELHLQVNLIAEEEITKILELLSEVRSKMGIKKEDAELERMLSRIDTSYIESSLERQIDGGLSDVFSKILPIGNDNNQNKNIKEPPSKTN